jgi:hypothetical protein
MTQLSEAIARYHKILEGDATKSAEWMAELREQMAARQLVINGRPVTPVLRPHFLSRRQYINLVKSSESLYSAIDRVRNLAMQTPALLNRMLMLPAEKMLASVDPGYRGPSATALLDTQVSNGSLHFTASSADLPEGLVYTEILNDVFFDAPPVKELRKKYKLAKLGGSKPLVAALLKTWKEFGGKTRPRIAILENKQVFQSFESNEHLLIADLLLKAGFETLIVTPEQLEYRHDVLRAGDFAIDMVYRGVRAHEFLLRFDLSHPLVRAYREHKVCVVNSFRTELTRKMALFDLLSDEHVTAKFPAAERKAVAETIPWTRVVAAGRTTRKGRGIDLFEYILKHRASLTLKPNDNSAETPSFVGASMDDATWERALRQAQRTPYVVQERLETHTVPFPVEHYGEFQIRELNVDVNPLTFLGKVHGVASRVSAAQGGFSSIAGLAPTFVLEGR